MRQERELELDMKMIIYQMTQFQVKYSFRFPEQRIDMLLVEQNKNSHALQEALKQFL